MRYLVDTDWVIDYMHGVRLIADREPSVTTLMAMPSEVLTNNRRHFERIEGLAIESV